MTPTIEVSSVAPVKQAHRRTALQGGLQPAFIQALKIKGDSAWCSTYNSIIINNEFFSSQLKYGLLYVISIKTNN